MFCLGAISLSACQNGSSRLTLVGWPLILTDLFSFDDEVAVFQFDPFVGTREQRRRHRKTERLRGLEIEILILTHPIS